MAAVIGIDLSLTATGVATSDGLHTVHSKPTGDTIVDRLTRLDLITAHIISWIPAILDGGLAVIEGPSYGQMRQGGEHLRAGLWWRVADTLALAGWQLVEVPPASVKKFATGKGNATKPDMRMALYKRAGLDIADDNQVDAWWLRQIGLHLLDDPDRIDLPATHLAGLAKVNRPHMPHLDDAPAPF